MLSKNVVKGVAGLAAVFCLGGAVSLASGQVAFTLQNAQNTASGNLPNGTAYSASDGVTFLSRNDPPAPADHIQDVVQQWFFYSTGSGPNQSIGTLALRSSSAVDTTGDGLNDQLSATYGNSNNSVLITVTYNLNGSGTPTNPSYQSNLSYNLTLRTTLATPTNISLYTYTALQPTQIQSPASGLYGQEPGTVTAQQIGHNIDVQHIGAASGTLVTDATTVTDPVNMPSRYQIATDPASISALLNQLNGGTGNLSSLFSSPTGVVVDATGGSVAYAFEYDLTGVTTTTYTTSETLLVTPEPASLLLLGLGGSLLVLRRRSRKA